MPESKAPRVNAVHRGLQILEMLAEQRKAWSTSEISRRLKIPKSTASYLLHTLETRGYLHREENGNYRLSMKLLALGSQAQHGVEVREVALPILRRLVAETGITGHLAVLEGNVAIYIERVPAPGFIQMDTWVGRQMPLHSTSSGKALLAFFPENRLEPLLSSAPLPRFTPKTIIALPRLKQELKKIREAGFAVDDEENTPGVRCVAAPIFDRFGREAAAISVTGPVQQIPHEHLARIAEKVKEAARQITRAMGGGAAAAARKTY
ncbi:MAG: IclR family transcriptional regulator [Terriglobia bacterium]